MRCFLDGSTIVPGSGATCAAPSAGVLSAVAGASAAAFGFHMVVQTVRNSRSSHALSVDGMREESSMKPGARLAPQHPGGMLALVVRPLHLGRASCEPLRDDLLGLVLVFPCNGVEGASRRPPMPCGLSGAPAGGGFFYGGIMCARVGVGHGRRGRRGRLFP